MDLTTYEQVIQEVKLPAIVDQDTANQAQRVVALRKNLIERVYSIRELRARAMRAHAEAMRVQAKLSSMEQLWGQQGTNPDESVRLDLQGRIAYAEAQRDYCKRMSDQCWMELAMFRAMLIAE